MSIFSTVKAEYAKTSLFNLSHEVKNTMKFGELTPFLCQEVLPGDIWRVKTEILTRLLAMKAPIMHNVNVYTHFFFVPNRLCWHDWEEFITEAVNGTFKGNVNSLPLFKIDNTIGLSGPHSLLDHLGAKIETTNARETVLNALPILAYNKIWQDYYRDENLDPDFPDDVWELPSGVTIIDGEHPLNGFPLENLFSVKYRSFAKDYFTSALPWTQKGDSVMLPLGGSAPVTGKMVGTADFRFIKDGDISTQYFNSDVLASTANGARNVRMFTNDGTDHFINGEVSNVVTNVIPNSDGSSPLNADLSQATAVTINELRRANAIQKWLEANARGGSRYIELLKAHFGVVSDDARLQRAEYLGGGKSPIIISEVLQQSASTIDGSDTPQGNMAGHGIGTSISHSFKRRFKEHGYVIGIMSVMPKANYMQGIPRHFLKRDVFDFGWPLLANLGEQPIYEAELYSNVGAPLAADENVTFGYAPRYSEYKFINDQVAGDFRTSLDYWHLARHFGNAPSLNHQFISTLNLNPRIFPTTGTDYILNQMYLDIKCVRKLPKYGTPML